MDIEQFYKDNYRLVYSYLFSLVIYTSDTGIDSMTNLQVVEKKNWLAARNEERNDAFQLNNDTFRKELRDYMSLRSDWKAKEVELAQVAVESDACVVLRFAIHFL